MSIVPSESRFHDAADVSTLLGEELMKRGEEMLRLGRQLLSQADELNAAASGLTVNLDKNYLVTSVEGGPDEERSVGRQGEVRIGDAIHKAKALGTFTRREFEEATGLNTVAASKWLNRLVNNKPPIIERVIQGSRGRASLYKYLEIEGKDTPTSRVSHARQVDEDSDVGVDSLATGEAARYTGRAVGRSGKPGRDRRVSRQRRVKGVGKAR